MERRGERPTMDTDGRSPVAFLSTSASPRAMRDGAQLNQTLARSETSSVIYRINTLANTKPSHLIPT